MCECLEPFSAPTREWFRHAFGAPTEAQREAWPAIRSGRDVLVIAPTGSGKTLAAFLSAIDRLMAAPSAAGGAKPEQGEDGSSSDSGSRSRAAAGRTSGTGRTRGARRGTALRRGVRILYISPLKALAVDVAKNLETPLAGIAAQCGSMGLPAPAIRVATRSGDTTPKERRAITTHPPDILVTTPESLYLMLTSQARRILKTVDTVIVDEVHALAGTKRGAHLALSLERLDDLIAHAKGHAGDKPGTASDATDDGRGGEASGPAVCVRAQRIGLSATVNPPAEAALFLGGAHPVTIVDSGSRPAMSLNVVEPLADMRDLQSANVPSRAGGVDAEGRAAPPISGVTPAMRRLAERRGLVGGETGGAADAHGGAPRPAGAATSTADSRAIVGAAGDGATGSIWPAVERSVLDEILAHRTTLVFVNSRGLAEKLTARLNDLYAERRGSGAGGGEVGAAHAAAGAWVATSLSPMPIPSSPEGREGFAAHYDAVVGGTTQLVGSHGPDDVIAMAHHGSVSKDRRKQIEERLKRGELRCVVATSSLELGIDMGSVDLVIQIAPPLSVASGLQRVGRADHHVGGVSHALFYPLTREQIIGVAAGIESMRAGAIEPLAMPRNPLDILAQQTVAAAAMDDLDPDVWFATVRRAAPFAALDRGMFDAVLGMLTGAYDTEEFSAFRPPLMWNHDVNRVAARPGAQRLAVTSGGTIPDRGLYTVVLPEADAGKGRRRVGELDEEMVYESRVGDIITLGTSTWRIEEITRDRVVVTPAPGRTARLPFWHGEESGRDAGFGRAKGRFVRETAAGLVDAEAVVGLAEDDADREPAGGDSAGRNGAAGTSQTSRNHASEPGRGKTYGSRRPHFTPAILRRLHEDGLDGNAIDNLARLLAEQQAATGVVPSDMTIVIERCPDEEGDLRVIVHSPYGRRVHEPWSMAVTARMRQRYGFDGQAYAADDGIVLRIPDGVGAIDIRGLLLFEPDELRRLIETQVGESVLYAAKFRECAARSLYLPRTEPGRRVPLWQQRLRAAQLLAAARTRRNFPLLLETARECLQDVYDLDALRDLMERLRAGTIALADATTETPSPFAENLLFGFVGSVMYQYDVPQAERNAGLLSMDPDVLEKLLGDTDMSTVLDAQVVAEVSQELAARTFWNELDAADVAGRVTRYAKTHGPFTADRMIADLGIDAETAVRTLDELHARGEVMRGRFVATTNDGDDGVAGGGDGEGVGTDARVGDGTVQWLHKDVFRRIRARSLAKAREAVKPVAPGIYQAFLLDRQGVGPVGGERYHGVDGLMRVIEQLEGVALPAAVWESSVFPARVADYAPPMLDELLAGGEIVWVGSKTGATDAREPGLIAFHPADSMLLAEGGTTAQTEQSDESGRAGENGRPGGTGQTADRGRGEYGRTMPQAILDVLASGGAYHASQLGAMVRERRRLPETVPGAGIGADVASPSAADGLPDGQPAEIVDPDTGEILEESAGEVRGAGGAAVPGHGESASGDQWGQDDWDWSQRQFEEALWSLVWQGEVTNGSFMPVRALCAGTRTVRTPARASRRRIRIQTQTPMTLSGLWSRVEGGMGGPAMDTSTEPMNAGPVVGRNAGPGNGLPQTGSAGAGGIAVAPERRAIEQVEILLDRYGVVAQPLVDKEGVSGGFSALYPVLKRMEEHGRLVRGMFVTGFGAAQFAEHDTVDALREATGHMRSPVALSVLDPANLYGSALRWPGVPHGAGKPTRREGGLVVIAAGETVAYATPKSKHLTVFADEAVNGFDAANGADAVPGADAGGGISTEAGDDRLRLGLTELAYALRRCGPGTVTFADVNGAALNARSPYARVLHQAGFTPVPQGMRLY
ncbi:Lhr family helicase [Bifidobacterium aesculapii]|uniref:Lhr family helicase n=1 Tax=Bifidobacterium aesculapii TaxID=1329411 RepID=UPI0006E1B387